jgi:Transposase C of IS166 homeodomain
MPHATAEPLADSRAQRVRGGVPGSCGRPRPELLKALEIEKLRLQIAMLRQMQFGWPSERITRQIEQLELQLEGLETGEAEDGAPRRAQ